MGWEWHDRRRHNGQFVSDEIYSMTHKKDQLHIRLPVREARDARKAAKEAKEDLSDYVGEAIKQRIDGDKPLSAATTEVGRIRAAAREAGLTPHEYIMESVRIRLNSHDH